MSKTLKQKSRFAIPPFPIALLHHHNERLVLPFSALPLYFYILSYRGPSIHTRLEFAIAIEMPSFSLCINYSSFTVLPLEIARTTRPNQKTSKVNGSEKVGTRRWVIISSHDFIKRRDSRPWPTASPMVRVRSMYSLGYLVLYLMTLLAFSLSHCTTQVPFHWSWLVFILFHSLLWLCSFFPWSYDKLVTTSI